MMRSSLLSFRSWGMVFVLAVVLWPGMAFSDETVCIQCHSGQGGHLEEPVLLWKNSIHAANGNSCHGCHGGDPTDFGMAMSPQRGFVGVPEPDDIPAFCGRCHVGVLEDYKDSAHGQALGAGGPNCVTCHGSHGVKKASSDLINAEDCSRCHEYGRAENIKAAIVETDQVIDGLEQSLAKLYRVGIDTEGLKGAVFAERNRFHRIFHSVDVEKVKEHTGDVQSKLENVGRQIAGIEGELFNRKLIGGGVVALFLLSGVVAWLVRKTYEEDE